MPKANPTTKNPKEQILEILQRDKNQTVEMLWWELGVSSENAITFFKNLYELSTDNKIKIENKANVSLL